MSSMGLQRERGEKRLQSRFSLLAGLRTVSSEPHGQNATEAPIETVGGLSFGSHCKCDHEYWVDLVFIEWYPGTTVRYQRNATPANCQFCEPTTAPAFPVVVIPSVVSKVKIAPITGLSDTSNMLPLSSARRSAASRNLLYTRPDYLGG